LRSPCKAVFMESKAAFIQAKKKVAQGTMANMFKIRSRAEWKRRLFATFLVTFSLLALVGNVGNGQVFWNNVGTVVAASQTGTATILAPGSTVSVTSRVISVTNCGTSCSSGNNLTGSPPAINVNTEYWFSTVVGDSGGLSDIEYVVIYIYKTGITKTTFDQQRAHGFRWVRQGWTAGTPACSTSGGCWQELTGADTWIGSGYAYLVSVDSSHTTGNPKTGTWTFAAQLAKLAQYTSTNMDWNYEVNIRNRSGGSTALRSGVLDVNLYVSVTVPSAVDFGTVSAGATNSSAPSNPYASTYTGNAILLLQVWGTADPSNEFGDSFPLSSIYVGQTANPANNDGKKLTTSPQNLYSNLPVALNQNMYWYITTPDPFPPGTYTFQYVINIDYQTWAT